MVAGLLIPEAASAQPMELPLHETPHEVIRHEGFSLLYDEEHEQASWVAYELTAREVQGGLDRTDDFRPDPSVPTQTAELVDYKYSGFDRGHLIPAADAGWSPSAMSATFFLSNMSPQDPAFNRGGWRKLESYVRRWASDNEAVYVVTGPALEQGRLQVIGKNEVSVPRYYYKVVLDYRPPEQKGIGFIVPNRKLERSLRDYVVSIDSVEAFTGLNFYPRVPDRKETRLESLVDSDKWTFSSGGQRRVVKEIKEVTAKRCLGITGDGTRCKRKTTNASGYCWQHEKLDT